MEVAKAGTPAGLIATSVFRKLAEAEMASLGITALPVLVVDHPLGGERPEAVGRRAEQAVAQLVGLMGLGRPAGA
jgi:hypothetical protein